VSRSDRRLAGPRARTLGALVALGLAGGAGAGVAQAPPTNAHWYIATYSDHILVWDEATEGVVDRIPVQNRIPIGLTLSGDGERLYVQDPHFETIEVVDIATKSTIREISLTQGRKKVRINGFELDPRERRALLYVKTYDKLADRYEVEGPVLLEYDLEAGAVSDTIDLPGENPEFANFRFSPDGELLYVFEDDLIALDTETWEEVDRWAISEPLEPGLGPMSLPFGRSPYRDDTGVYTGLFRVTDPAQGRRMMGIATVDLNEHRVDFAAMGPSEPVSFALSADGRTAYGLQSSVGHYEFWKFDVPGNRVVSRVPFPGRPRMALMPSADGTRLFIFNAGNTIDVYDSGTFEHLRTIELDEDMTDVIIVPQRGADGGP